jgi:hypothetical protein
VPVKPMRATAAADANAVRRSMGIITTLNRQGRTPLGPKHF